MVSCKVDWDQVTFYESMFSERTYHMGLVRAALYKDMACNMRDLGPSEDFTEWHKLWRSHAIDTVSILGLALLPYENTGILWSPYGIKTIPQTWIAWYRTKEYEAPYQYLGLDHGRFLNNTRQLRNMRACDIDRKGDLGWNLMTNNMLEWYARQAYVNDIAKRGDRAEWAREMKMGSV